jgi:pyridoxamine 5'-phosphate oxidase
VELYAEAIERFAELLGRAKQTGLLEPTAMTVATATPDGHPSVRTILLKGVDDEGFVFFTNKESRKGEQLAANPRVALCFHWDPLKEQVSVEGRVASVSDAEADEYWATRPRESQVGAWASQQSRPLASRDELMGRVSAIREKYADTDVPRPPYWSGYRIVPDRIEFWTAGEYRLHRRVLYEKRDGDWTVSLLNP